MNKKQKIAVFAGALLVKFVFYLGISFIFVLLFWWAGITQNFNWKHVLVLALGLLFLRIFLSEILVRESPK